MGRITMIDFTNKEVIPWYLNVLKSGTINLCRSDSYARVKVSRVINHLDAPEINNDFINFAKQSNMYYYDFKTCISLETNKKNLLPEISYYGRNKSNGKHMLLLTVCKPYKVIGYSYRKQGVRPVYTFRLNNDTGVGELIVIDEWVDGFVMKLVLVTECVEEITFSIHNKEITYTSNSDLDQRRKFEFPMEFKVYYKSVITDNIICGIGQRGKVLSTIDSKKFYKNMEIHETSDDIYKIEDVLKKLSNNEVKAITIYGDIDVPNSLYNKYSINFVFRLNDDGSVTNIKAE